MCIVLITIGRPIKFVLKNFKKAIYRIQKQEVNKNADRLAHLYQITNTTFST